MTDATVQPSDVPMPASRAEDQFPVEAKDLVVFATFLSSVAALVYDSGFFWGLDLSFFTFFTLAEHLLFGLEAIPITLGVVFSVLLILGLITSSKLRREQRSKSGFVEGRSMSAKNRRMVLGALSVLSLGAGCAALYYLQFFTFFVGSVLMPVFILLGSESAAFAKRIVWVPTATCCLILVMFVFGIEIGHDYAVTKSITHTIFTKADPACSIVRILRSGAAGVLFIDQPAKQLNFVRWDDIKRIKGQKQKEPPECPTTPPAAPL